MAVKPIPTVPHALRTIDLASGQGAAAIHQRSDVSAVVPAAVIGEAMMALTLLARLSNILVLTQLVIWLITSLHTNSVSPTSWMVSFSNDDTSCLNRYARGWQNNGG